MWEATWNYNFNIHCLVDSWIDREGPVSYPRGSCVVSKKIFIISPRILCHIQENTMSSPWGSCVISRSVPCHLQECPVSSSRGSCVISKRILCHLRECPVSSSRGSCVISKRILRHLQEDPVSSHVSWVIYQNNFVHPL